MGTRVLIVDDSELFRGALRAVLSLERTFSVVGEAGDGSTALRMIADHTPEVVIIDITLPDLDGIEVIRRIRSTNPLVACVVLSGLGDGQTREDAFDAGAVAVVGKERVCEALFPALALAVSSRNVVAEAPATPVG